MQDLHFVNRYSTLPEELYSKLAPTPFADSFLIHVNQEAAALLDLDSESLDKEAFTRIFSAIEPHPGMQPLAMCYAGHQFGTYVPRLGDGRAILLGEVRNSSGKHWELHLKGAGLTPYSRDGDGRAVLRSSIREYLCSEAMHALGIPSTRALCLFGSNEEVYRERIETGAMLLRMAQTHIRFGHFEYCYYNQQFDLLEDLTNHTIRHHFPWLMESKNPPLAMLEEVIGRTATLIAKWQANGFAHGVMNTDNMSIIGLTLDYGPFGFLDAYQPDFICNHSDYHGRYAFNQQPKIGLFNCSCLAQALLPVIAEEPEEAAELARALLADFQRHYETEYQRLMRKKLGFTDQHHNDDELIGSLLALLAKNQVDYTLFFRNLCHFKSQESGPDNSLRDLFLDRDNFDSWADRYRERLSWEMHPEDKRRDEMRKHNPKYVLRNYMAQMAIEKAEKEQDYSLIHRLNRILSTPFDEHPDEEEEFAGHPPDWASKLSVSCSS